MPRAISWLALATLGAAQRLQQARQARPLRSLSARACVHMAGAAALRALWGALQRRHDPRRGGLCAEAGGAQGGSGA